MSIEYDFDNSDFRRTPEQVALREEYRKNEARLGVLHDAQKSLARKYDDIERSRVKTWEEAKPEIMPLLISLVAWMRGETGEPLKGRGPDHCGWSFRPAKYGWFVAGRPKDGWMEIGYNGVYGSGTGATIHPGKDELVKAGNDLAELVGVEDWWIGSGNGIGFCCQTDAKADVVTELPPDLAAIYGNG